MAEPALKKRPRTKNKNQSQLESRIVDLEKELNRITTTSAAERLARIEGTIEQIDKRLNHYGDDLQRIENSVKDFRAEVNQRFEKIDQRFEKIDQRFEKIDQRFEKVDQRFSSLTVEIEQKLKDLKVEIISSIRWNVTTAVVIAGIVAGLILKFWPK